MVNTDYLTPDESREVFNDWIKKESSNFINKDNVRFQIVITKMNGYSILRSIKL